MPWVNQEKDALVATLRDVDPEAPTLDDGWNVRRLVGHLVQREQSPVNALKDVIARKPPGHEPELSKLCDRARTDDGYARLVDRFVDGPPRWSPMSWAAEQLNFVEYLIHHEDVRRAGPTPQEPRRLPREKQDAVWKQLGLFALTLRRSPLGVTLATPTGQTMQAKKGDGVTLTAEPVELALWLSGRRDAAQVEITGDPDRVERFNRWAASR